MERAYLHKNNFNWANMLVKRRELVYNHNIIYFA